MAATCPARWLPPLASRVRRSVRRRTWIAAYPSLEITPHRGGRPGFIKVLDPNRLRIPDYPGNSMFNTLGNFVSYPHAGLVFIDFARSRMLQLTGRPELMWDARDERGETGGINRYWELAIEAWREAKSPFRIEWELIDHSPFLPTARATGSSAGDK